MIHVLFLIGALHSSIFSFVAAAGTKPDALVVYGEGFAFTVSEPEGWKCLCGAEEATRLGANAVFIRKGETLDKAGATIRVRVNKKTDEHIEEDMKADVEQYRSQYPGVKFKDLQLENKGSKVLAKIFYKEGSFFEYVAYLNPGPSVTQMFSSSMNVSKRDANSSELGAYKAVVSSLHFLTDQTKISLPQKSKR